MIISDTKLCFVSKTTCTVGREKHVLSVHHHIHSAADEHEAAYHAGRELMEHYFQDDEEESIWTMPYDPDVGYLDEFRRNQPPGLDCESDYEMQVWAVDSHDSRNIEHVVRVSATIPLTNCTCREYLKGQYWHASSKPLSSAVNDAVLLYANEHPCFGIRVDAVPHAILIRSKTVAGVTRAMRKETETGVNIHVEVYVVDYGEEVGGYGSELNEIVLLPGAVRFKAWHE